MSRPAQLATGAEARLHNEARPGRRRARQRRHRQGGAGHLERDERAAHERARAAVPRARLRRGALSRQDVERARLVHGGRARGARPRRAALAARRLLDGRRGLDRRRRARIASPGCSASRRGFPSGCRSTGSAASGSTCSTAPGTATCRGFPASARRARGAASSGRERLGVEGSYTLIPRGLHGAALRRGSGAIMRLPRAHAWVEGVGARLEIFSADLAAQASG